MMRWGSLDIAETLDELVVPASTVLIMWDYARGLVGKSFNRESFVSNSAKLLRAARRTGVHVFYGRQSDMTFTDVGVGLIRMRMREMKVKSDAGYVSANRKGSPAGEFVDEVAPLEGEVVFEKFLPSAFSGTNLSWRLRTQGIKTLVFAGISLETGIVTTALEALCNGYYSVIVRDAVSSQRLERFRPALEMCEELHDVATTDEVVAAWERATPTKRA